MKCDVKETTYCIQDDVLIVTNEYNFFCMYFWQISIVFNTTASQLLAPSFFYSKEWE